MLSKKEFVKIIETIKKQEQNQEKFIKGLESLSPGTYCDCLLYSTYQEIVVDLLMDIMNDKKEDIPYFLYELDYLNKDINNIAFPEDEKGNKLYTSIETLYDYLISNRQEEEMLDIDAPNYYVSDLENYLFDTEE